MLEAARRAAVNAERWRYMVVLQLASIPALEIGGSISLLEVRVKLRWISLPCLRHRAFVTVYHVTTVAEIANPLDFNGQLPGCRCFDLLRIFERNQRGRQSAVANESNLSTLQSSLIEYVV